MTQQLIAAPPEANSSVRKQVTAIVGSASNHAARKLRSRLVKGVGLADVNSVKSSNISCQLAIEGGEI